MENNVKRTGDVPGGGSLTFRYQSRLNQMGWLEQQCDLFRSQIRTNQTVFPYLSVPPLSEEHAEQFHQPLAATRIAVLHVWSSDDQLPPPFFQYWVASAVANDPIADFLIFVPDQETSALLEAFIPNPSDSSLSNVRVHVVGNLQDFYHSRIGDILYKTKFRVIGSSISRLKPMLGCVFEEYIREYSHWAWADMDLILGNLTKFLGRPIAEGYDVITMTAVEQGINNTWTSHVCYGTVMAGQFTVFANTNETRNYFRHDNLGRLRHLYDEKLFPALLNKMDVRIAHVLAQVSDRLETLQNSSMDWSRQGLFKAGADYGSYEYEAGLVHVIMGKRLVRVTDWSGSKTHVIVNPCKGRATQPNATCFKAFEDTIFPPFAWENTSGFVLQFPVRPSAPCEPYDDGPTHMLDANVKTRE
ncbi:hypothetical protein MHU86_9418 [Fragilaria crotonensis]|nr:hypothetical protein MHU86_9418 [Fragilaria crotonensis]